MHLPVRGRLQRSGRIWNFGTTGSSEETTDSEDTTSSEEYHEVDDLNSPTLPPAYSEAFWLGNELPVNATRSVFSPFMIGGYMLSMVWRWDWSSGQLTWKLSYVACFGSASIISSRPWRQALTLSLTWSEVPSCGSCHLSPTRDHALLQRSS
jgi:hypothetical protein